MTNYKMEPLSNNVEEMFIGPFGSSLKNDCFVEESEAYCMVYEQKHAIQKTMNLETRYVNEQKYTELKRFNVKGGDIIVSCRGTIGETYVVPDDAPLGIMHPSIMKIRLKDGVYDKKYFDLLLKSRLKKHESEANGSGVKMAISATALGKELFPVPTMSEQNEISKIISTVSDIIVKRKKELNKLDNLIKARFVELFGRPEDKKYPSVRLGDYAKLQGGYAFKSKDFVDEGVPLVQIGNVNKDYLDWDVVNAVPEEYIDKYSEFALSKGDLVMAMTRPIIKSLDSVKIAKVAEDDLPCLLNQRVGRFQIKDKIHPVFLEILCKTDDFKDYVERMSGNSLQPNISSKQVEDYIIILPPIELQEKFAEFVKQVDKSKVAVQKALDEAQLLFDSLMQKYFG